MDSDPGVCLPLLDDLRADGQRVCALGLYMCVCMYVCVYIYIYTYTCVYICMCIYIYIHIYNIHIDMHTHMHACMHACMHVCKYCLSIWMPRPDERALAPTCLCVYIYIYILCIYSFNQITYQTYTNAKHTHDNNDTNNSICSSRDMFPII